MFKRRIARFKAASLLGETDAALANQWKIDIETWPEMTAFLLVIEQEFFGVDQCPKNIFIGDFGGLYV